jgi:Ca2+-binding RTX toxin-like protein
MLTTIATAVATVLALGLVAPAAHADETDRTVMKRWIQISRVDGGFRYQASLHDNDLTVTRSGSRVLFADRTARVVRTLPRGCHRVSVETGRAVSCRMPAGASPETPVVLDIEPQRGNDRVDASALGAEFTSTLLGAQGDDELLAGAGADFVNGAGGVDQVHGGPGNDTIRTGDGDDVADGGVGDDHVIGTGGNDQLAGSVGDDVLEGGDGNDLLLGGPGEDSLLCGDGDDTTDDDGELDLVRHCEHTI